MLASYGFLTYTFREGGQWTTVPVVKKFPYVSCRNASDLCFGDTQQRRCHKLKFMETLRKSPCSIIRAAPHPPANNEMASPKPVIEYLLSTFSVPPSPGDGTVNRLHSCFTQVTALQVLILVPEHLLLQRNAPMAAGNRLCPRSSWTLSFGVLGVGGWIN